MSLALPLSQCTHEHVQGEGGGLSVQASGISEICDQDRAARTHGSTSRDQAQERADGGRWIPLHDIHN